MRRPTEYPCDCGAAIAKIMCGELRQKDSYADGVTNANTGNTFGCGEGQDSLPVFVLRLCRPPRSWASVTSQGRYVDFEFWRGAGGTNPFRNRDSDRNRGGFLPRHDLLHETGAQVRHPVHCSRERAAKAGESGVRVPDEICAQSEPGVDEGPVRGRNCRL